MFLAGIYLSLNEVASYGLMMQLVSLIGGVAGVMFTIYQPRFASLRVANNNESFCKEVAYTMCIFYILYFIGSILLIFVAPHAILLIGSATVLPGASILLVYATVRLLDYNFWNLCQTIIAGNDFPFLKSCLITGLGITIGCYISLSWLNWGIWGIVISTGLVQSAYNNWYWPRRIFRQMNTNILSFIKEGYDEIILRIQGIKKFNYV